MEEFHNSQTPPSEGPGLRAQTPEQDIANTALRTAEQTKNMGDSVSRGADVKANT